MSEVPNKLVVLESLLRRLPREYSNYEYYQDMYYRVKKGYERVKNVWKEIVIPTPYYLLQNFETENEARNTHQIDFLFLSPNFILLLEIKNISGRIDIDPAKHQLIRTKLDGTIESFYNPVNQSKRHVYFLRKTISNWGTMLPIEYAIVLSNPSTVLGNVPNQVAMFHLSGLPAHLAALFKLYPKSRISLEKLELLNKNLLSIQKPILWDPKVDKSWLRKGAICNKCTFTMVYQRGRFICPKCKGKSKSVLIEGLHDYRLLFKPWITNQEFTSFFSISSKKATYKLLSKLNLEFIGVNRGRKYYIPKDILEKKWK